MKKPISLRNTLFVPTFAAFTAFVAAMVLTAYLIYASNVKNSTDDQMLATSQQLITNYETYFDSVLTTSNNVVSKYSNESDNLATISADMSSYFDVIMSIRAEILDISLYKASDGTRISSDSAYEAPNSNVIGESWFIDVTKDEESKLLNVFSRPTSAPTSGAYSFTLSKYIPYENDSALDAVLKADFDFTKIVTSISPSTLGDGGHFIIYDKNYGIVYSSSNGDLASEISLIRGFVLGSEIVSLEGHSFYLYAATISNTTWRVAIAINYDAVTGAIGNFSLIVGIIGVGIIAVFAVILSFVAIRATRPLRKLQTEMADIESLNYDAALAQDIKGPKEVAELNKSFNQMMARIKELTENLVSEKEEQRKSELKALQNQINPHFLYNALDSVVACIDKGESQKAEEMIIALSKFFRISISKGQNIIPLTDEIEHVRNYLLIQKLRFGNSFDYRITVAPGLERYYVVKLILQPIVENSIGHGLREDEKGFIVIKAYEDGDFLKFEISDNGYGMMPSKVKELEASLYDNAPSKGVGLKNVYQRIRIYYGEKADLLIRSVEDVGTTVTIVIPKEGALRHEE